MRETNPVNAPLGSAVAGSAHRPRRLLLVVACALVDDAGRILLARRPEGKALAGLWEFPGGKLDPGENPERGLVRELAEELGIEVDPGALEPFAFASHAYEDFDLLMPLWLARRWAGAVASREGQALAWVPVGDLHTFPMPPADIPLVRELEARLGPR